MVVLDSWWELIGRFPGGWIWHTGQMSENGTFGEDGGRGEPGVLGGDQSLHVHRSVERLYRLCCNPPRSGTMKCEKKGNALQGYNCGGVCGYQNQPERKKTKKKLRSTNK